MEQKKSDKISEPDYLFELEKLLGCDARGYQDGNVRCLKCRIWYPTKAEFKAHQCIKSYNVRSGRHNT